MSNQLLATVIVVLLHDLMVRGDLIPKDTVLEVDREVRNDWKGSSLCRDATEAEIAEYRDDRSGFDQSDELDEIGGQVLALQQEVRDLEQSKETLGTELATLRQDKESLGTEVVALEQSKKALTDEVEALKAAKKAATAK